MVDLEHDDLVGGVVDAVEDAKGPPPRCPDALELVAELAAESVRVLDQWTSDEVDDSGSDCLWELLRNRPCGRAGDDQLVGLGLSGHGACGRPPPLAPRRLAVSMRGTTIAPGIRQRSVSAVPRYGGAQGVTECQRGDLHGSGGSNPPSPLMNVGHTLANEPPDAAARASRRSPYRSSAARSAAKRTPTSSGDAHSPHSATSWVASYTSNVDASRS